MTARTMTSAEYLAKCAGAMTEAELLTQVSQAAKVLGLLCYHTHDSRRSEPGFPDLVIVGRRGVIFRELKTQRGRLTVAQDTWRDGLNRAGSNATVWRPTDLINGTILDQMQKVR